MDTSTSEKIKEVLHRQLEGLGTFEQCALLSYPDHYNVGDHLIWLGTLFYLKDVLKTKINYAASIESFSELAMEEQVGKAPIIVHGGGNLGDIWSYYQKFYEGLVSKYQDRPIIIMPQSIYFANLDKLKKAANVFNAHPNLTICARENYSYELASQHFHNCQLLKAPDMAFQLANLPGLSSNYSQKHSILYHCRGDKEFNETSSPTSLELPNLVVEDWASYKYKGAPRTSSIAGITRILQDGWQQGSIIPVEWISRQIWQNFHSYTAKFEDMYEPSIHRKSWKFMHNGVYQFKQHRLIVTNRLHGHILCVLLGIPHVFLANAYHKNESFYQTWTYQIPYCKFVKDASQVKDTVQELLDALKN
ncbi:polysaccharide pyruvyl transferase family protein [Coleofasciculus sp. FACHB-T130]|uniref:polysaccharide pyruvyl transferase family protein n=1 Tax=Cyanophyceae TaxID=3028117 RepID=UPI001689A3F5|nr:polysaccharide pyruvyl transferase family protein [Coleofasciculus sp. FACHB-T130]MBD1879924.1 polysaccharide pyruvyl transferase family protein [Coleofasciculus sp. FACHB-T130]